MMMMKFLGDGARLENVFHEQMFAQKDSDKQMFNLIIKFYVHKHGLPAIANIKLKFNDMREQKNFAPCDVNAVMKEQQTARAIKQGTRRIYCLLPQHFQVKTAH